MARIVITRPNGETEYAELTMDKSLVGNDRLAVEKAGTVYYAKLDNGVSTHMYVIKPDGRKLYVQKNVVAFMWKYLFDDTWETASKMVIPRTGRYKLTYANDQSNQFGGEDIFKEGDKFTKESWSWYLQGKTDQWYHSYTNSAVSMEPHPIESIEYIGEA